MILYEWMGFLFYEGRSRQDVKLNEIFYAPFSFEFQNLGTDLLDSERKFFNSSARTTISEFLFWNIFVNHKNEYNIAHL